MSAESIIYDGDPGSDDALAIIAALGAPERLKLLGISTVYGNVPLELTSRNALALLELCRRTDVKVHAGHDRPLVRSLPTSDRAFGQSGLGARIGFPGQPAVRRKDAILLPKPKSSLQTLHAVDFIVGTVMTTEPGTVTLVATGPLTNIAVAFIRTPDIERRLKRLVIMGGGYRMRGNITPDAEFNFFMDPEATARVLFSEADITLVSLDTTAPMVASKIVLAKFAQLPGIFGQVIPALMAATEKLDRFKQGADGAIQCDPVTICYLLQPDLFELKPALATVSYGEHKSSVMLTLNTWGFSRKEKPKLKHVLPPRAPQSVFSILYDAMTATAIAVGER